MNNMIPITFILNQGSDADGKEVGGVNWPQIPPAGTEVEVGGTLYEVIGSRWHENFKDTAGQKVMGAYVFVTQDL
ncbi:MAG: hypothetical protein V4675_03670 [Verrucomicrobiota bacterium]